MDKLIATWEYGCDAPRNGGAPYIGATIGGHFVRFRIEDDFADAVKRHTFLRTLQSHLNAAPAGGDVAVGEIGELNGTKLIVGRDEDALARLPKGTKLYTRPQDSAPAGGDYRGTIPKALDETINGVVSDLEMIAAGKDQVTGDPVSGLQSQRIAKSAHDRLLSSWSACDSAPAGSGEVGSLIADLMDAADGGANSVYTTAELCGMAAALLRKLSTAGPGEVE